MPQAQNGGVQYLKLEGRLVLLAWQNDLLGYRSNCELLADTRAAAEGNKDDACLAGVGNYVRSEDRNKEIHLAVGLCGCGCPDVGRLWAEPHASPFTRGRRSSYGV